MAQPRIVEVDYYTFQAKLKAAAAAGARIERTDGDRWLEYIKGRNVNLYSIQAWAKVRFTGGDIRLAIIDAGGHWDGVYAWCEEDERAARWESGDELPAGLESGDEPPAGPDSDDEQPAGLEPGDEQPNP